MAGQSQSQQKPRRNQSFMERLGQLRRDIEAGNPASEAMNRRGGPGGAGGRAPVAGEIDPARADDPAFVRDSLRSLEQFLLKFRQFGVSEQSKARDTRERGRRQQ